MSTNKEGYIRRKKKADSIYQLAKIAFFTGLLGILVSWYILNSAPECEIRNWWFVGRCLTFCFMVMISGSVLGIKQIKFEESFYSNENIRS